MKIRAYPTSDGLTYHLADDGMWSSNAPACRPVVMVVSDDDRSIRVDRWNVGYAMIRPDMLQWWEDV